jgi:hypothetical protein
MSDVNKTLSPAEIEAIISSLILILQLVSSYIGESTSLTAEEKAAFIERIKTAQATVPEWK